MNDILAGIYGTHGFEKVAAEGEQPINHLSDLALAIATEAVPEGTEFEKVASVHDSILEDLEFYDLSGRAAAHAEFTQMEKQAAEGDPSALHAFFDDVVQPETEAAAVQQAVLAELARRTNG